MNNDLAQVTKLAEECGAEVSQQQMHPIYEWYGTFVTMKAETLLAYTQKVEQAVLTKRDEEHDSLVGQLELEIERLKAEVAMLRDALPNIREELRACQAVIHLAGGFDPAYVQGAKAAMSVIDNLLSSKTLSSEWLSKHDAKVRQAGYDQAMKERL